MKGHMAKQVKRIGVGALGGRGQFLKRNPLLFQSEEHIFTGERVRPLGFERLGGTKEGPDLRGGVIGVLHRAKLLAVRVQFQDLVADDAHLAAVHVVFPGGIRGVGVFRYRVRGGFPVR